MSRKIRKQGVVETASSTSSEVYKDTLHKLQAELVKLQHHFIKCNDKILIIFEGRDASGKDGTIKRVVQHLIGAYPALDGIHWDYIRFAGKNYGYNQVSLDRFNSATASRIPAMSGSVTGR